MNRLYPKKSSGRFYILSLLRIVNERVAGKYIKKGRILDFGCGSMPYKPIFEQVCDEYKGIDFSENQLADFYFEDGIIPVKNNSFDYVISTQVLEHVTLPEAYLTEAMRVLKENGLLLLSTHGYWKYHPDPTDYWRWTKDGLIKLLESQGFKIIECYGLMGLAASGLQLFQDGFVANVPVRLRGTFFRLIAWLQRRIDKWDLHSGDASVYYFICQKR